MNLSTGEKFLGQRASERAKITPVDENPSKMWFGNEQLLVKIVSNENCHKKELDTANARPSRSAKGLNGKGT